MLKNIFIFQEINVISKQIRNRENQILLTKQYRQKPGLFK
jgi:hypothetical protein